VTAFTDNFAASSRSSKFPKTISLIESPNKVGCQARESDAYAKFMLATEYGILSEVANLMTLTLTKKVKK